MPNRIVYDLSKLVKRVYTLVPLIPALQKNPYFAFLPNRACPKNISAYIEPYTYVCDISMINLGLILTWYIKTYILPKVELNLNKITCIFRHKTLTPTMTFLSYLRVPPIYSFVRGSLILLTWKFFVFRCNKTGICWIPIEIKEKTLVPHLQFAFSILK